MLRCSVKLLKEGVQNTSKTNGGCVFTKALSTKTLVVKHDDVNHMFYIQVDNGMAATAVTHFSAKGPTALPCIQARILFFLARNCPTAGIVHVYTKPTELKLTLKDRYYQRIPLYYVPTISHLFVSFTVMLPTFWK